MPSDDAGQAARTDGYAKSVLKLLSRMRRSKSGYGESQLRKLYEGFGFIGRDKGDHVFYYHPDYPRVRGLVPRHRHLRDYVVSDAIDAIDELLALREEEANEEEP